jgi:uncharacterized protein (UPF0332 family)
MAQSDRTLAAAEALAGMGLFPDAVNRLYYAVFHMSRAILLTEDIEPTSHEGAGSLLGQHFIKPGRLPSEMGTTLRRLRAYREAADYERGFVISKEECLREMEAGRSFLETARAYLEAAGGP